MAAALPRGVRNCNPGNIDYNPRNTWNGQLGLEQGVANPRFARFDSPENGIRALGKLLINYRGKDGMPGVGGPGIDTVRETVSRWAPGNENNTEAYIAAVTAKLGVKANDVINIKDVRTLRVVVGAIIAHECANYRYPDVVFNEGIRRALA
ncbi:structural protein P5 [Pseudomonas kermanshahensis]|uniref:structural protein P5 n=1 Tax=Pseudomonas kermanshahensis TaxID=2745482 RepID=UPI0023DADC7E|nr:structural protein P5 [Pseudomonas kermanshahensis]WEL56727.1 structural protein P5 [Pseudomonas kermanshahensis]